MWKRWFMIPALACAGMSLVLVAADKPAPAPIQPAPTAIESPKMMQKVFAVADLVVPLDASASCSGQAEMSAFGCAFCCPLLFPPSKNEERLMQMITSTVEPKSWCQAGGQGSVEYFPIGMGLVVYNSADVIRQVETFLESLRSLQEVNVEVHLRLLQLSDACFKKCGLKLSGGNCEHSFCNENDLRALLECVQADPQSNIMCMPRLMVMNGQTASVRTVSEQYERGGVHTEDMNGSTSTRVERVELGTSVEIVAAVSAHRTFVNLTLNCKCGELPHGDAKANKCATCCGTFAVPCSKSVVVYCGTITCLEPCHAPLLTKLPYLNRLFREGAVSCEKHCVLIATPTIRCGAAQACPPQAYCPKQCQSRPMPLTGASQQVKPASFPVADGALAPLPPAPAQPAPKMSPVEQRAAKMAEKLVEKYYAALEKGEAEKARKYARQALDLDPGCFGPTKASSRMTWPRETQWELFQDKPGHLTPDRVRGGME